MQRQKLPPDIGRIYRKGKNCRQILPLVIVPLIDGGTLND